MAEIQEQIKNEIHQEMGQQLVTKAQEAINAAASSDAMARPQDSRIQALEVGLQELQGQNKQFHQWFQEAGDKLKANENSLGAIQHTLNVHQNELHSLGSTFHSTMKTVKTELSSELNDTFNKQFTRLEALLDKKQRTGDA